ncbi:NAD-dependent epimerase/dehydratase family protein [Rhodovulum strictum]|uniref:SDR family NAD(P)-dependent oxidoreductase n=1 Tax=Rhodovulum strictum TaxID=58314 RepID=A0A844BP04_9RHOB|nr:NAD-dependent epimerase/dehydratase family protein [Rhodovulum strictum]MRH22712.1 SDR family NAD(P)-dependent oxidoreductase [Rhodovulum strictum]
MSGGALAGRHLFVFGAGYTASRAALRAHAAGARVSATTRDPLRAADLVAQGVGVHLFDTSRPPSADRLRHWLDGVTDLLVSVPPDPTAPPEAACPVLAALAGAGLDLGAPRWIGYLSSSAVYGDCGGAWIDETRPPAPISADARGRVGAEIGWRAVAVRQGAALDILRIAGIYGPGPRNALAQMRSGRAQALVKPGQVFNRIHAEDVAGAILAAMTHPQGERLTNLSDDLPAAPTEVLDHAAQLLGLPPPPRVAFDPAALPPGVAAFWAENRRLRNDRLRALPGFALAFPTYREGLAAILDAEKAATEMADAL